MFSRKDKDMVSVDPKRGVGSGIGREEEKRGGGCGEPFYLKAVLW